MTPSVENVGRTPGRRPHETAGRAHVRIGRTYMEIKETETATSPFLSYDLEEKTHRSAKDEWQPHRTQSDRSFEW